MKDSSVNRWLWLIGLVAVALLFVSFGPLSGGSPGENASGATVAHWYDTHVNQQWATVWMVGSPLLLMIFVTQLRTVLVEAGGQGPCQMWSSPRPSSSSRGSSSPGSFEMTLILASHNHDYTVAHFVNFYSTNNELLFLAGVDFLTLSTGFAILLNRGVAPLPKLLGWYSVLVAVVGAAGPLSFFAILFGLPVWILATGIVIAVKQRRGTLGGDPDGAAAIDRGAAVGTGAGKDGRRLAERSRASTPSCGGSAEPPHDGHHLLAALGRVLRHRDAGGRQRVHLGLGRPLGARDDGAGVAHLATRGRGDTGDVGRHRLRHVILDELGGALLLGTTDLADHHDGPGVGVGLERPQAVDEVGARHGSPPMPTQVVWPMPCWESSCRAW